MGGICDSVIWFYSYSVTGSTWPSHYPLHIKCIPSMQSDFSGTTHRGQGSPCSCFTGSLQLYGWGYLSHQGTWMLQPLGNAVEGCNKCVKPLDFKSMDLCVLRVARCLPCKDTLVWYGKAEKASPESSCPAYLQACIWKVWLHELCQCLCANCVAI